MPGSVLVSMGGGAEGEEALQQADRFARMLGARLTVALAGSDPDPPARRSVIGRIEALTGRGPEDFEVGRLAERSRWPLAETARTCDADLVVVGAPGVGGVVAWLRGGEAAEVIRHGRSAVLVVRPSARSGKVLCATDLSDPAFPAVRTASEICRRTGARLTALHCIEEPASWGPGEIGGGAFTLAHVGESAREALERKGRACLRQALAAVLAKGTVQLRFGVPSSIIVRLAAELPADLVVVGTAGRAGLRRLLLGSTAEAVLERAHCSVLVERLGRAST